ncbi:MAG: ribose-phosphate pyrophosphokinase [Leptotrichiaceae bacterium]|jgi:ribose-phosphate pyrophosphokinase|nr:ribose-phosphate pyrophosphokinase [Leptotrichiaceae bacterium]MBP6168466.1 ribose-phosphate pyrophosphokinase [Leptotrichiaceae bacterium]MBP7026852.1 ribose-phosphate pyrophosphokinase [Leptotrichiaceae bacterium]MBP8637377.1 ribose-phosphate pyrophosphokinase [Leptotrichiaceae bacterium]MBP9539212.1 ribose-phosphate pyrophosphokinase [Leptotrichiaceae bacterium]
MMNCAEPDIKVYAGPSSQDLARRIVKYLRMDLSSVDVVKFADGETFIKTNESVRGSRVFVVQSTSKPVNENIMDLLIFIDSLKRASAEEIIVVIPYYGYARQDRKASPREPITSKLVANLLTTAGATRVVTMDLHARQIQGFFDIPVDHIEALPVLAKYLIKNKFDDGNTVVVSPDVGGVKRARGLANWLHAPLAIIDKRRAKANVSEVMNLIGDVKGKRAILIDDMIDTAGTICNAAVALKEAGATEVYACATHAVFSEPAVDRLKESPFSEVIVTDSIELPEDKKFDKLTILSTSKMFAEIIKRIYSNEAISDLFELPYDEDDIL